MCQIIEKLIARGVPYDEVMERFVNDQNFYFDYLHQFTQDEYIILLEQALEQSELEDAFKAAHTLKGLMANLGLLPLVDELSPLVELLRAESLEGTDQLFYSFKAIHQEFCDFIKKNVPKS